MQSSRRASERRIAGTTVPRHPQEDRGSQLPLTPAGPGRQKRAKEAAEAPTNRAPCPNPDSCQPTPHCPTSRALKHTANNTLPSADRHHRTAAQWPRTSTTQYTPHRDSRSHKSTPHRDRRSHKARERGTSSSTNTPPPPPSSACQCPNSTATPSSTITTAPQHN